jgi:hypothetical protein
MRLGKKIEAESPTRRGTPNTTKSLGEKQAFLVPFRLLKKVVKVPGQLILL